LPGDSSTAESGYTQAVNDDRPADGRPSIAAVFRLKESS
jgi:hypothetical protein